MHQQLSYSQRKYPDSHHHRNSSISHSKYSKSSSKRKYIEVVSKQSPKKNNSDYQSNLRASSVSLSVPHDNRTYVSNHNRQMSYSCVKVSHAPPDLARSNSQMIDSRISHTGERIIIKQTVRAVPVNVSFLNPAPIQVGYQNQEIPLNKKLVHPPRHQQRVCFTPCKTQIVMSQPYNKYPITIISQKLENQQKLSYSYSQNRQPQKISTYKIATPSRFSLQPTNNPPPRQNSLSRNHHNQNPIPTRITTIAEPHQNIKKQNLIKSTAELQPKKLLSNQVYMNQEIRVSQIKPSPKDQPQNLETCQSDISKYDSLTITKQDRVNNLKENLQIGKNCLCHKILQFTRCQDIKIKRSEKNSRQALQPKKNILY